MTYSMSLKILSNGKRLWTHAKDTVVLETSALMVSASFDEFAVFSRENGNANGLEGLVRSVMVSEAPLRLAPFT